MRIENKGLTEERRIYSVSELTEDIKILLENTFPAVWVEGEVSNFKQYPSGHIYFTLKDENSNLLCVFFRGSNQRLKFQLKDGLSVIACGRINVYPPRGQYQLNVQNLEPKGKGALQLAFEQLKERLQKEGLFAAEHKKPIPVLPLRIGVVTSPAGAAIRDILNILKRRAPFAAVGLNPVKVQGEGAAEEIANAIRTFNQYKDIDVLIVGRGGGSLEDLWAFNEEIVARAIYNSNIPVISCVGHETDVTISDFVADLRAPTPSAAAELVVKKKEELYNEITNYLSRMHMDMADRIRNLNKELKNLAESYVLKYPLNFIQIHIQHVDEVTHRLWLKFTHILQVQNQHTNHLISRLQALNPVNLIPMHSQRIDEMGRRLKQVIAYFLQANQQDLSRHIAKLEILSPLNILSRGYSISFKLPEMEIIKDIEDINIQDKVRTRLKEGSFISQVITKSNCRTK